MMWRLNPETVAAFKVIRMCHERRIAKLGNYQLNHFSLFFVWSESFSAIFARGKGKRCFLMKCKTRFENLKRTTFKESDVMLLIASCTVSIMLKIWTVWRNTKMKYVSQKTNVLYVIFTTLIILLCSISTTMSIIVLIRNTTTYSS